MRSKMSLIAVVLLFGYGSPNAAVHTVAMVNYNFVPETLAVLTQDTVLWINQSASFHTTTSGVNGVPDSIWDSGSMAPGDSFAFHFTVVRDYPYYCTPHWQLGMIGLIRVTAGSIEESQLSTQDVQRVVCAVPVRSSIVFYLDPVVETSAVADIYDLQGSRVRTLRINSFSRSLTWDLCDNQARRVKPGIYFASIATGTTRFTAKFIVIE